MFIFNHYVSCLISDSKKDIRMQNSGDSEFSTEGKATVKLSLTFWQSFLLALAGAAGLNSMLTDGPLWISITGFTLVIVLLFWLIVSNVRKAKK
jgi:hypothetical protein